MEIQQVPWWNRRTRWVEQLSLYFAPGLFEKRKYYALYLIVCTFGPEPTLLTFNLIYLAW
jgi:hypothetical protein